MGRGGTYHKYYYSRKEACWRIYVGILNEQSQEAGASWLILEKLKPHGHLEEFSLPGPVVKLN